MFPYVGVTEGTHICINSSVPTNAYLWGIKANGFGFNTAGSDKCQCSLEFKIDFICTYPLLQTQTRGVEGRLWLESRIPLDGLCAEFH